MEDHSILWRRIDTSGHETARVYGDDDGWYLDGSAIFLYEGSPCRLEYFIECDTDWTTRSATVDGWVGEHVVECEISVSADRLWYLDDQEIKSVEGCIDLDLNFSPVTNLLPLRRLNLKDGGRESVSAAWLKFPSFTLERLEQSYSRIDGSTVKYESRGGEFVRELKVNQAGLVIDYPGFWIAEADVTN